MLEAVQKFLNYYTDEMNIECIVNNRIASLYREDILKIKNINDSILVKYDDFYDDSLNTQTVKFQEIKITSDIVIYKD